MPVGANTRQTKAALEIASTGQFATMAGVSDRAARKALCEASEGKPWRGHHLPVVPLDGHRGGAGGKAWGLVLDAACSALRAELNLPETPSSTLPSTVNERRLKGRPDDRHFALSLDRQRIIAPILDTKRGSAERGQAFRAVAARPHRFGDGWQQFSERTLRDWVKAHEERGPAALVPAARRDRGKPRVRLAREWHRSCGLAAEVQDLIADQIERTARGLIVKRQSDREVRRLCSVELARLTAEAGVKLPRKRMKELCHLSLHWARRFAEMKPVRDFLGDHKRYSDDHEFRVHRSLTREPMEVLFGDVHHVDVSVGKARRSLFAEVRQAANRAAEQELVSIRVSIIGWLDGSSHYLWATPVSWTAQVPDADTFDLIFSREVLSEEEAAILRANIIAVHDFLKLVRRGTATLREILETRGTMEPDIAKTLDMLIEPAATADELHDLTREYLGRAIFVTAQQKKGKLQ